MKENYFLPHPLKDIETGFKVTRRDFYAFNFACFHSLEWSPWGPWSACSKTCNAGQKYRMRSCVGRVGGCRGKSQETSTCNNGQCKGKYPWSMAVHF